MLTEMPDRSIADQLQRQLRDAQSEHISAIAKFNELMSQVPTGDPNPDASLTIQRVAEQSRAALRNYMHALDRYIDFVIRGIVPEDLKRSVRG